MPDVECSSAPFRRSWWIGSTIWRNAFRPSGRNYLLLQCKRSRRCLERAMDHGAVSYLSGYLDSYLVVVRRAPCDAMSAWIPWAVVLRESVGLAAVVSGPGTRGSCVFGVWWVMRRIVPRMGDVTPLCSRQPVQRSRERGSAVTLSESCEVQDLSASLTSPLVQSQSHREPVLASLAQWDRPVRPRHAVRPSHSSDGSYADSAGCIPASVWRSDLHARLFVVERLTRLCRAAISSFVPSRKVISSRGTKITCPIGMLCDAEIVSPGWRT